MYFMFAVAVSELKVSWDLLASCHVIELEN